MYSFYQPIVDSLLRNARKVDKKIGKQGYVDAIALYLKQRPDFIDTLDFQIIIDELWYIDNKSSAMYFIKDEFSFNAINDVRIEQDLNLERYITESEIFSLVFPQHLFSGVLVSISDGIDIHKSTRKHMDKWKLLVLPYDPQEHYSVSISYEMIDKTSPLGTSCYRTTLPASVFSKMAFVKTEQEFVELYLSTPLCALQLTHDEMMHMYKLMRFVCKFIFYKVAAPTRIVEGAPTKQTQPKLHWSSHNKTFSIPHDTQYLTSYRSGHIRALKNPRFYKGQYSHLKPGDRLIEIEPYVVNRKVDTIKTVDH
jgi:hypothetical protein